MQAILMQVKLVQTSKSLPLQVIYLGHFYQSQVLILQAFTFILSKLTFIVDLFLSLVLLQE